MDVQGAMGAPLDDDSIGSSASDAKQGAVRPGQAARPAPTSPAARRKPDSSSPSRGFSRVAPMRKIVNSFVKRSRLEISSLHISQPDSAGLCAKGKIRLTHLGNGPVPVVGLRVKFKDPKGAALHWSSSTDASSPSAAGEQRRAPCVVDVLIEPLTLQSSTPGSVKSEVDMRFVLNDQTRPAFIEFVRHIIQSDAKAGTHILMKAVGVQIKAFGLRFGDLKLEKDVVLGGLGCLGGVLTFDSMTPVPRPIPSQAQTPDGSANGLNGLQSAVEDGKATLRKKGFSMPRLLSAKQILPDSASDSRSAKGSTRDGRARNAPFHPTVKAAKTLQIDKLDIVAGDAERGLAVSAFVTIENPAREPELIIEPGELRFKLCIEDRWTSQIAQTQTKTDDSSPAPGLISVGMISLAENTLRPGMNRIKTTGFLCLPPVPRDDRYDADSPSTSPPPYEVRAYHAGQKFIASIMQNEGVHVCAVAPRETVEGQSDADAVSTVGWLAAAFQGARIDAYIPPLGERVRLLDGAEVRVEGTDDHAMPSSPSVSNTQDLHGSVARATLRNGFNTDIHVYDLFVSARSAPLVGDDGTLEILELGKVFSPGGSHWRGLTLRNGSPEHVSLPMEINADPRVLIEILRKSARTRNIDLGNPLSELLEELRFAHWNEAGFAEPPKSRPSSSRGSNSRRTSLAATSVRDSIISANEPQPSDDLAALLSKALANMRVTAHIEAVVSIGNYALPGKLAFEQRNLPIALSTATAAALLPLVGKPFVKAMVDRAEIEVQSISVLRMDDRGIQAELTLQLVNFGPLSAQAEFDEGLLLRDANLRSVAVIHFDGPLGVEAGSDDPVKAHARIVPIQGVPGSSDIFADFVGQLLRSDKLVFNARADPISITSGGVHFRASLEKEITILGLGGFSGLRMTDLQILGEASAPAAGVSYSVAAPTSVSQPTAISFAANAQIDNQGDINLLIKKLEVAIAIDDVQIGQASIDDLDLRSGRMTSVRVKGIIYTPPIKQDAEAHRVAIDKISKLISTLVSGKEANIEVLGRRAWVASDSRPVSLAWLDAALRTFTTSASIQWKDGVQIVTGIDVGKVEATFAARKSLQLRIEEVMAQYSVPFPVQFEIQTIDATMDIMFGGKVIANCHAVQDTIEHVERPERRSSVVSTSNKAQHRNSSRLQPVPQSSMPRSPSIEAGPRLERHGSSSSFTPASVDNGYPTQLNSRRNSATPSLSTVSTSQQQQLHQIPPQTGKIKLSLKAFELKTKDDDEVLGEMVTHIVEAGPEGTKKITLRGLAHVTVKTAVGILKIVVPLGADHKLDISGLDGLRHSPLHYTNFEIISGNPKYIRIKLDIESHNPSAAVSIQIPDSSLSLAAYYEDAFVGDVVIGAGGTGIEIRPGHVSLEAVEFHYRPTASSEKTARPVLTKLFGGEPVGLSIRGHRRSSVNAALSQALRTISMPIQISPLRNNDILEKIRVQLGMSVVTSNTINATYILSNPINIAIDVLHLEVKAYYRSNPFGNASKSFSIDGVPTGKLLPSLNPDGDAKAGAEDATDSPSKLEGAAESANASKRNSILGGRNDQQRLHIPGGAKRFEGDLVVKLQQAPDQLVKAFLAERGNIILDVDLTIKAEVQGYVVPCFLYRQKVPLEVQGLQGIARLLRLV